ncbi:hypothetical protein ZEAMMB73_Zm00001d010061 [Zea mays]|nr:hypothetical protein ZEAMMB73_Zm00001d010061 [Zea mays]
MRTCTRC